MITVEVLSYGIIIKFTFFLKFPMDKRANSLRGTLLGIFTVEKRTTFDLSLFE